MRILPTFCCIFVHVIFLVCWKISYASPTYSHSAIFSASCTSTIILLQAKQFRTRKDIFAFVYNNAWPSLKFLVSRSIPQAIILIYNTAVWATPIIIIICITYLLPAASHANICLISTRFSSSWDHFYDPYVLGSCYTSMKFVCFRVTEFKRVCVLQNKNRHAKAIVIIKGVYSLPPESFHSSTS